MNTRSFLIPMLAAACIAWPLSAQEKGDDDNDCCCKKHVGEMRDGPPKEGKDKSGGPRGPSHEELLRLIERFDTNHDGKLSDEEKSKLFAFLKLRRDGDGPQDRKGDGDGEGRPDRKGDGGDCDREHPDRPDKDGPKGPPRFKPGGPDGFKGPPDHFRGGPDKPKGPPPRDKDCCCHHEDGDGDSGMSGGDKGNGGDDSGSGGDDRGSSGRKGGPKGNNGLGNGEDPQPPGNPPVNDGSGTGPGHPGNKGHGRK